MANLPATTREFRYGVTAAAIAFPFGLGLGGLAVKVNALNALFGSPFFTFKAVVALAVFVGFSLGVVLAQWRSKKGQGNG